MLNKTDNELCAIERIIRCSLEASNKLSEAWAIITSILCVHPVKTELLGLNLTILNRLVIADAV